MVMEYRPLLEETQSSSNSNKKQGSRKTTILGLIAIIAIFVTFIIYNNGHRFFRSNRNRSHVSNSIISNAERNEKLKVNLESITFQPDLQAFEGVSIELYEDVGDIQLTRFENLVIDGKFYPNYRDTILEYHVNGDSRQITFQLFDKKSNDLLHSFYAAKSVDSNKKGYYAVDGVEVDPNDQDSIKTNFLLFYGSDLAIDIIQFSVKLASYGYSGPMAKSVRMIHAAASHLSEMPDTKQNLPKNFHPNRQRLNDYFVNHKRTLLAEAELTAEVTEKEENNDFSINPQWDADWCLFGLLCDSDDCPGGTDGCPSTCYINGKCEEEDKCDNECFGGCGDGCDCWSWVCGDCDCHCLCENHDYFCSCESTWEYECWAMYEWLDDDCD